MTDFITTLIVGVIIIILGIVNMTGNINSLHSYHRKNVREEDKKPFGRLVGGGLSLCGLAIIAFSIFSIYEKYVLGTVVLVAGLVIGFAISFYAMIKYNKGIF